MLSNLGLNQLLPNRAEILGDTIAIGTTPTAPTATASVSSVNTFPSAGLNENFEVVETSTATVGAQLVDPSLIGQQTPASSFVPAEITATGLVVPSVLQIGEPDFSPTYARDLVPDRGARLDNTFAATAGNVGTSAVVNSVKSNAVIFGAGILILGIGYLSARGG